MGWRCRAKGAGWAGGGGSVAGLEGLKESGEGWRGAGWKGGLGGSWRLKGLLERLAGAGGAGYWHSSPLPSPSPPPRFSTPHALALPLPLPLRRICNLLPYPIIPNKPPCHNLLHPHDSHVSKLPT